MFLNLSNHPSANWSAEQTEAAMRLYGVNIILWQIAHLAGGERG